MVKLLLMLVPAIDPAKKNQYVVSADTGAAKAGTGVVRPNPYVVSKSTANSNHRKPNSPRTKLAASLI